MGYLFFLQVCLVIYNIIYEDDIILQQILFCLTILVGCIWQIVVMVGG